MAAINVTQSTKTVTTVTVDPIILTGEELDALANALVAAGFKSNVPLNAANIQSINLNRRPDGKFVARIQPVQPA